ncbi:MAG: ABC transporter permease, partial [Planctomycetia bacterium]
LPLFFFATFFGGIDFNRVAVLGAISIATIASVAGLSLVASVYANQVKTATTNVYMTLVFLLFLPLLTSVLGSLSVELARELTLGQPIVDGLTITHETATEFLSAGHPLVVGIQLGNGFSPLADDDLLWLTAWYVGIHFALTALFLTWTIWKVRTQYLETAGRPQKVRSDAPGWKLPGTGRGDLPLDSENPMLWKEWRIERRPAPAWRRFVSRLVTVLLIGGAYTVMVIAVFIPNKDGYGGDFFDNANTVNGIVFRFLGTVLIFMFYILTVSRASSSFGAERDRDCWVSLLSTPLSAQEIVRAKLIGSLKLLLTASVVMAPLYALGVVDGSWSVLAVPCLMVAVAIYGFFLAALGVNLSLRYERTVTAMSATFGVAVFLCGFGQMLFGVVLIPFMMFFRSGSDVVGMTYMSSFPWLVVAATAFTDSNVMSAGPSNELNTFIACIFGWLVVYWMAAWWLFRDAIGRFPVRTGRTEDVLSYTPPPPPLRRPAVVLTPAVAAPEPGAP